MERPVILIEQGEGEPDTPTYADHVGDCATCEASGVWLWDIVGEWMCQECICD